MSRLKGEIEIKFDDKLKLELFLDSLKPEINTCPSYRSRIDIKANKSALSLYIIIESDDIPSFRASMNSFLRILGPLYILSKEKMNFSTNG